MGRLELIIGGMFSGKSTELIRRINREKSINKKTPRYVSGRLDHSQAKKIFFSA